MATRGPKLRTAANAGRSKKGLIRRDSFEPPSELNEVAKAEYWRLVEVLRCKGTLDRVDLGAIVEAARVKDVLDRAYAIAAKGLDMYAVRFVALLTTQRRGLIKELGLTLQPSRSVVKTNAVPAEEDPMAKLIKLGP
jgi:phage terminase small subunit